MGVHTGDEGVAKVGTNTVAEVRSWTITETADAKECTSMGDTWRNYKTGRKQWTVELECWWDETDTNGQEAMNVGNEITLNLYSEGDASGDTYFTGSAIVIERGLEQPEDAGIVTRSIKAQGNGILNQQTVV